jgi:dihydroxy-acid dehydratase
MKPYHENKAFFQQPENARGRALLRSMGYTAEDLERPKIGVANSWAETSPGHIHLKAVSEAVKAGIWQAGGTPIEFNGIAQCPMAVGEHGMRYDLPTRDVVAAEVETLTWLQKFDALVLISSCDKNVPGHLLAAARMDLPAIVVPGGPMAAGRYCREDVTTSFLDAHCWAYGVGEPDISPEEMAEIEERVCPGAGACALLGTANTMQCLTEALGIALPGSGTALATSARRLWLAKAAGRQIVRLVERGVTARQLLTRQSLCNAIKVLHALGGSTNAIAHLLALGYELEMENEINLELFETWSNRVPCITDVQPGGTYTLQDLDEAGGVYQVMKAIAPMLETDVMTVTLHTLGENLADVPLAESEVIRSLDAPLSRDSLAILSGNLASSAVVRTPVIPPQMLQHSGPARVYDSQEAALQALRDHAVHRGDVIVLRYEGPRGGPGFNEVFKVIGYLNALGLESECALVTDGRISGFAKGPYICQVSPEAAVGGPLAIVRDGDRIEIDVPNRKLDVALTKNEIEERFKAWTPPRPRVTNGLLTLYARCATPAEKGGGLDLRLG